MKGFPLAWFHRELAEGHLKEANAILEAARKDMNLLLEGKERTNYFKPDTDPVEVLIEAAQQQRLCETVLKLDDDAKLLEFGLDDGIVGSMNTNDPAALRRED